MSFSDNEHDYYELGDLDFVQQLFQRFTELTSSDWSKHIGKCTCPDCSLKRNAFKQLLTYIDSVDISAEDVDELYTKVYQTRLENRRLQLEINMLRPAELPKKEESINA